MAYDPDIQKVVLFAGSGNLAYKDTWFYDGATNSWAAGPATPSSVMPRAFFGMTYDPNLHQIVVVGGDQTSDAWYFDGTTWTSGPTLGEGTQDNLRERTTLVYDPQLGADLLYSGLGPGPSMRGVYMSRNGGAWDFLYQDVTQPRYTPPSGRLGGAMVFVSSLDTMMAFGGVPESNEGQSPLTDAWYFRDVPPQATSASLDSYELLQSRNITVSIGTVVGGYYRVTRTIRWLKNGAVLPGVTGTVITPQFGQYRPGDTLEAQVQYVDIEGVVGPWVSSGVATVANPVVTVANGVPGTKVSTTGVGFGANELVDLHIDSSTGAILRTITANPVGQWSSNNATDLTLPTPLVGGPHTMHAIGRATGSMTTAAFTVAPAASISPASVASGGTTTLTGNGFGAGVTVTASFPGGAQVSGTASSTGAVTLNPVSPAEPWPGGSVTVSAPSGSFTVPFNTVSTMKVSGKPAPTKITLALTGWGASETVTFTLDGQTQTAVTNSSGSATPKITLRTTWGKHVVTAVGATSGINMSVTTVWMYPTMTYSPTSGPPGAVVTIDSGSGWTVGSRVTLYWGKQVAQTLTADADGSIHTSYTIGSHPPGTVYLKLQDAAGNSVKKPFTIT
jgi:galactose oxidase-like protein